MQPALADRRLRTPGRRFASAPQRSLPSLTVVMAAAAVIASWQPARAGVDHDENWANAMMASQHEQERDQRRWGRAGSDVDEDDVARPRRATRTKRKSANPARQRGHRQRVASLGQNLASAPLRPLSIIEWARPKEALLVPKATAEPPKVLGPMLASLGREFVASQPSPPSILSSDQVRWLPAASIDCLAAQLRTVMADLVAAFGPVTVRWTCRSKTVNARVGGAKRSYHLTGDAIDFNVTDNYRAILSFLKANKLVGGLKHYGSGAFHIDTGPRRTW
jgi:Peptidase M15